VPSTSGGKSPQISEGQNKAGNAMSAIQSSAVIGKNEDGSDISFRTRMDQTSVSELGWNEDGSDMSFRTVPY
jgi:hypothetical protein